MADYFAGFRDTLLGATVGAAGGAVAELVADEIIGMVIRDKTDKSSASLSEDIVELTLRSAVCAAAYLLSDRLIASVQRERVDLTEGLLFTYFLVENQPSLVAAGNRLSRRIAVSLSGIFASIRKQ